MGKLEKRVFLLLFSALVLPAFCLTAQEKAPEGEENKEEPKKTEEAAPAAPAPAPAKPLRKNLFFRYGKLLAAEAVTEKPQIEDPTRQMRLARGSVYAQLVFRADKGRSISIHDFALADESGKEYNCIAIAEGKDPYSGLNWIYRDTNGTSLFRMLFALPSGQGKFQLVFKLLSSEQKTPFFLLREKDSFSGSFPDGGALLLPKPPPPPAPAPAEEEKKEEKKEGETGGEKQEAPAEKAP